MADITGTAGNDTLQGTSDNDSIDGGEGNDRILPGNGEDTINGGDGDDDINGNLTTPGSFSSTTFFTVTGAKLYRGGNGRDVLIGGVDNDTLYGDDGSDGLYGKGGNNLLYGGNGDDYLSAEAGNDIFFGGDGKDSINGGSGDDSLNGGAGDDSLSGAAGQDVLDGGEGNDSLYGGDGNDVLEGGSGNDYLFGQIGNDTLIGNDGNDSLSSEEGDDLLEGRAGADFLWGRTGNDTLSGGDDNDTLFGDEGNDDLIGGKGTDVLLGGAGNDSLRADGGNDSLNGGEGDDVYYLDSTFGVIVDSAGADTAYVSADFLKIPSYIEKVIHIKDAQPLPYWISALVGDYYNPEYLKRLMGDQPNYFYNFPTTKPAYVTDKDQSNGWEPFTSAQQQYAKNVLTHYSSVVNLAFLATDTADKKSTLVFANNIQTGSNGYAALPADSSIGSDVYINVSIKNNDNSSTLFHEIGHALGLKHPFDESDAFNKTGDPPFLQGTEDSRTWTVMSYGSGTNTELKPLDLAALHYLYGPSPTARAGNDTYFILENSANFIWDGSGIDTLDGSRLGREATLYLEPGYWGFAGKTAATQITAAGQVTINFGSVIENLVGTAFADQLTGSKSANTIRGGAGNDNIAGLAGNDTLFGDAGNDSLNGGDGNDVLSGGSGDNRSDGGAGIDMAQFDVTRAQATIGAVINGGRVVSITNAGKDTLLNIERIAFSDVKLAFDQSGNGGKAAAIVTALHGSSAIKNPALVGKVLAKADANESTTNIALGEIASLFGSTPDVPAFISAVYANVAGSPPPADVLDYYSSIVKSGEATLIGLALFAIEHPANQASVQLIGIADTGLQYV